MWRTCSRNADLRSPTRPFAAGRASLAGRSPVPCADPDHGRPQRGIWTDLKVDRGGERQQLVAQIGQPLQALVDIEQPGLIAAWVETNSWAEPCDLKRCIIRSRLRSGRCEFSVRLFKILVIQAANKLSDERTQFLINDRLSFMRFLGLSLSDRVPDARTIWLFREKLTKAGAIQPLFARFYEVLRAKRDQQSDVRARVS